MKSDEQYGSSNSFYTMVFVRNAVSSLEQVLEGVVGAGGVDEEEMSRNLGEAIALLAKAWHVRGMGQQEFEQLSGSEVESMRNSVPDLAPFPGKLQVVQSDWKISSQE